MDRSCELTRRSTLEVLGEVDPRFAAARADYLANPKALFEPMGVLADLHALRRLAAARVQFSLDERRVELPRGLAGELEKRLDTAAPSRLS